VGASADVPDVASLPLHAPPAVQAVALAVDQVRLTVFPTVIDVESSPIVAVGWSAAWVVMANVPLTPPIVNTTAVLAE
jgi:hypothetical protein